MDNSNCNKKENILSEFAQSVLHADISGNGLGDALKILGKKRNIPFLSVHLLNYDKEGKYSFSCIGHWRENAYPLQAYKYYVTGLQNKDLPDNLFESNSAYIKHTILLSKKNTEASIDLIIIPLFLSGAPLGILSLGTSRPDELLIDIFITAASIIELWADRENEKKLCRDIISELPHPVIVFDKNEIVTMWNKACERMTRWMADDVINKHKYTAGLSFYGIKRPMAPNLILNPDPSWEPLYYEFKRLKDGDIINAIAFCNAIVFGGAFLSTKTIRLYNINEKISGAVHAVRDLYLEKEVVENLRQTESMYKTISDFAGVGIILLNGNEIIYCNKQMKDFIGANFRTFTVKDFLKWINQDGNRFTETSLKLLINGGNKKGVSFEFKIQGQNDEPRFFRSLAGTIEHEGHPAVHIIVDDITEAHRMAEKTRLDEIRMLHQSRLSSLGVMASSVAHELNQPLNIIKVIADGFLYGREQGWNIDQSEFYEDMGMISRQVARMDNTVRNIQSCYSREEQNIDSVYINVNEAIENVFIMMEQQLNVHGIVVKKYLQHPLLKCKGNKWRMEQAIMNLLINARQALDETNHTEKCIIVKTSMSLNNIEIEISDNATGIPYDIKDKIFDPFFTTKESSYGTYGTGLGLAICQSIIFEFGGNMDFFNNDQGGVTFLITLPGLKGSIT